MRVRIIFLEADRAVRVFDRTATDPFAAKELAAEIAKSSGIVHDSQVFIFERKCQIKLLCSLGGPVEILETKALDEADAIAIAKAWAAKSGVTFEKAQVAWKEASHE